MSFMSWVKGFFFEKLVYKRTGSVSMKYEIVNALKTDQIIYFFTIGGSHLKTLGRLSLLQLVRSVRNRLRRSPRKRSSNRQSRRHLPFERSLEVVRLQAETNRRRRRDRRSEASLSPLPRIFHCSGLHPIILTRSLI